LLEFITIYAGAGASREADMKMLVTVLAASILVAAPRGSCNAQVVVKQEPLDMRNGATVLVDDGTCGKGKVKLVTVTHGNPMPGKPLREVKCVPK
jgi:uncharacterized protein DUF6719